MQIFTGLCYSQKDIWLFKKYSLGMMLSTHRQKWFRKWFSQYPLALDNGAFAAWKKGEPFPEKYFLRNIDECLHFDFKMEFVVCPDIVAGGKRSLDFSLSWHDRLKATGYPIALAVQDGMSPQPEMLKFDLIFVGGTPRWKWRTLKMWCAFAHAHQKPVHVGQAGTLEKLRTCRSHGVTSCDSTSLIRNGAYYGDNVLFRFFRPDQYRFGFDANPTKRITSFPCETPPDVKQRIRKGSRKRYDENPNQLTLF